MNILLIAGGWSTERDVSLAGGKGIAQALARLGHEVSVFDPATGLHDLAQAVHGRDFAFINLHGSPGEDGLIQAMLEGLGCPYQGSGPAGSIIALNKAATKMFFRLNNLPTADWELLTARPGPDWRPAFAFPVFIKANTGGSSLHMEKVETEADLPAALDRLFGVGKEYLVEPAVTGAEITCGVLGRIEEGPDSPDGPADPAGPNCPANPGNPETPAGGSSRETAQALPPILIKATGKDGLFDYASKYTPGGAEEICPAPISPELTARIQELALAAHNCLGLSGYSRADFIVPEKGDPVLLEVNTLPGMTATSLLPQEAAAIGLSFDQLIQRLVDLGLRRFARIAQSRAKA